MKLFITVLKPRFIFLAFLLEIFASNPIHAQGAGSCLAFDGIDDYVLLANPRLDVLTDFTVEGWIKPDPSATSWNTIWEWTSESLSFYRTHIYFTGNGGAGTGIPAYVLYCNFFIDSLANRALYTPAGSLKKGEWNHFAVMRNGTTFQMYINGINQPLVFYSGAGNFNAGNGTNANDSVYIGSRWGMSAVSGHEQLDEIRLWNVARTQTEIRDNMCRKLPTPYPSSLIGYWDFHAGTSPDSLYDLTTNSINGGFHNMSPGSWVTSGAPIGDASSYLYPSSWTGQTIGLNSSANGNFQFSNVNGLATTAHVYRVDAQPNTTAGIMTGLGSNNTYYGTFITDSSSTYTISYNYSNYPNALAAASNLTIFTRHDNSDTVWHNLNPVNVQPVLTNNNVNARGEFSLACTTCSISTQDLVGCYPFDNNANDFSGNNYNGTAFNVTPTTDRFGNPNSAYHFSGASGYVQIPTTGYLLNEYTYSIWCKPTSLPNAANRGYYSIIAIGGTSADQIILLGNDNQTGFIGFGAGTWSSTAQPHQCYVGTLPAINQWYHLTVTRNNTQLTFYINSTLICTTNYSNVNAGYIGGGFGGSIGSREVPNVQNFIGDIDDVRIYNRVLTQTEIQNMPASCGCLLAVHLGADTSVCSGSSLILNTGNSGSAYTWYLNGAVISTATAQTFQPLQSGQYVVTVNGGSCSASDTINVTMFNLPTVLASPDVVICNGVPATLSVTGAATYQWSPAATLNTSSGSMVIASPSTTTSYLVIGTDINNCSNQDAVTVTVNPIPSIAVSPAVTRCSGNSATLTANGGISYSWSPSVGLNTTSGSSVNATPSATTTYTVTGTDINNCHNSASVMVSVNPLPNVQVTPGGTISICGNNSVTLSANIVAGYQYQWYYDTTLITFATSFQFIANSIGNYWVHVTDSNGCAANSQPVTVIASSTGPLVTITSSPTIGCEPNTIYVGYGPQSVTLTANAIGAVAYLWSTGDSTQSITINSGGIYSVTAWDASGCASQQTLQSEYSLKFVDVRCGNDSRKIFLCHVPPGGSGNAQTVCISPNAVAAHLANHPGDCLGPCHLRPAAESDNVIMYPNPFSNTFTVSKISGMETPMTLIIRDMAGRIVESHTVIPDEGQYGHLLSKGVYFIEVISGTEKQELQLIKL